ETYSTWRKRESIEGSPRSCRVLPGPSTKPNASRSGPDPKRAGAHSGDLELPTRQVSLLIRIVTGTRAATSPYAVRPARRARAYLRNGRRIAKNPDSASLNWIRRTESAARPARFARPADVRHQHATRRPMHHAKGRTGRAPSSFAQARRGASDVRRSSH